MVTKRKLFADIAMSEACGRIEHLWNSSTVWRGQWLPMFLKTYESEEPCFEPCPGCWVQDCFRDIR